MTVKKAEYVRKARTGSFVLAGFFYLSVKWRMNPSDFKKIFREFFRMMQRYVIYYHRDSNMMRGRLMQQLRGISVWGLGVSKYARKKPPAYYRSASSHCL